MGFRFGKSFRLGKHFRINISKSGVGVSAGVKGLRVGIGPRGTRLTASVPGTGLSYTTQLGERSSSQASGRRRPATPQPETVTGAQLPSPGFFAPQHEKDFVEGIREYQAGRLEDALRHFIAVAPSDDGGALYAAAILATRPGDEQRAIELLETVIRADVDFPTPLMKKYGVEGGLRIRITPDVVAVSPMNSLGATLLLAELYQGRNRVAEAIGILEEVEELSRDPVLTLSLCELYALEGAWDGVVDRARDTAVGDDVTLQTAILYGRALQEKALHQAAIQVLTDALRKKKGRSRELLCEAAYWRAISYTATGKRSQADREFQKVYAQAPDLRDVAERVAGARAVRTLPPAKPERRGSTKAPTTAGVIAREEQRYCGQCGHEILPAANFCARCGVTLR